LINPIPNVKKVICVGTDKAVSPLNTYGATKLLMEKLFVTANNYVDSEKHPTKFTNKIPIGKGKKFNLSTT
jgi:FlaA1/EpsC-like NDP-sugar epimerase